MTIIKEEYKYSEITGKIIGCAMRVHAALGSGFQEVIYQRAMAIEMALAGLSFSREHDMPIYFKNTGLVHEGLTFSGKSGIP